ncbi:MAG: sporulation protein YunB [Firmicutes bacterium]|nr:sporulation protein YunB [Bacillota bacterium]
MRRLGHRPRLGFRIVSFRGRGLRAGRLRPHTLALLLVLAAAIAGTCAVLEKRVAPQVQALAGVAAEQQASAAVAAAVEQVLAEEQVSYGRLVSCEPGESGVRAIRTDAAEVNLLRGKINSAVEKAVALRRARLKLPLGALLGSSLFAGAGPNVTVPLTMAGSALSDIRSELSGAGVNQTMHRILMDLRVSLSVILPGGTVPGEVALTVCLAETVIVGDVPQGLITQK